jgi:spore coat polysaccharide biosynthesis predicted glycosyltransferase SpsG/GNAT superfamily N-acetyltransferase
MRILFHCNGGPELGIGHVMRSIALAEEATAAGHEVLVAGEVEGDFLQRQLAAVRGLRHVAMRRPAGRVLVDVVDDLAPDVVHLDTYDADVDLATRSARAGSGPMLSNVEDGDFGRREADLVVDPNLGAETRRRDARPGSVQLRGSRYTPLRRSVTDRRGGWADREAGRALVVMGGTDPTGMTAPALDLLGRTGVPLEVTAVVREGSAGDCAAVIAQHRQLDVRLVAPLEDLPATMVAQDLVVSAAGTSSWELCCLGVPTALVCTVDNQRTGYDRLVSAGAALGLGSTAAELAEPAAADRVRELLTSPAARRALSETASGVVDGLGAWRVVRAWECLVPSPSATPAAPVSNLPSVREAEASDARSLWEWRNDETTRASSLNQDLVPFEDHLRWLEAGLGRADRILLVAADHAGDVGTVRWDRTKGAEWEVSITVAPSRRGESLSRGLLAAGERELASRAGGSVLALARVQDRNRASQRLFETSGYLPDRPPDPAGIRTYAKQLSLDPPGPER